MDNFLGRVLDSLVNSGQLELTTIVNTADHGDEHLEHSHVGHASTAHHATLHEEVPRVPLLIVGTRILGPRRSEARVQLQDLMPTELLLAGL
jgi:arylsulfatase A-like enzyme